MKSTGPYYLALSMFCCLTSPALRAQEITIARGMSFDQVVEVLQKCGGKDITTTPREGIDWRLESYGIDVGLGEHYGKLNDLAYYTVAGGAAHAEGYHAARSLKFNPDKKTFEAENLPPPTAVFDGRPWRTRTEALFVVMPQARALALLPDLRDESKIESAYTQILADIQRKEARLIGCPVIYASNGQQATSETVFEKIYPSQAEAPKESPVPGSPETNRTAQAPTFEKRNVGVMLEMENVVRDGGTWIDLNFQTTHTDFDGLDSYEVPQAAGVVGKFERPRFYMERDSSSLSFRNGQRLLVGAHKLLHTDEIELRIVQVTAIPTDQINPPALPAGK